MYYEWIGNEMKRLYKSVENFDFVSSFHSIASALALAASVCVCVCAIGI